MKKAYLLLENEMIFKGNHFGAKISTCGEIVFQTGMVGYTESLSDPAYYGQILVLTYPIIGNYGVPSPEHDYFHLSQHFESFGIKPFGLVVGEYCNDPSHWQSIKTLSKWMIEYNVPGICNVDTREITKIIRKKGTMLAKLVMDDQFHENINTDFQTFSAFNPNLVNLQQKVSINEPRIFNPNGQHLICAIDCGIKFNQIRCLIARNVCVELIPWNYPFECKDYDGLFLSSGPGNPDFCEQTVRNIANWINSDLRKPVFGICFGHQLLAKASGATTYKMKYGNRGHNHPCLYRNSKRCFMTSQNHGYAVCNTSLNSSWNTLFSNLNDNTNEGIYHKDYPYFSVQFHPEHNAGPTDLECLFDVFIETVKLHKSNKPPSSIISILDRYINITADAYTPSKKILFKKVLIIGSGGLSIGQAGEFDYSGSQAIKALKEEGIETILVNPNIATVQTSKGLADKVYFLPLTVEYIEDVIRHERPDGTLLTFGGQTALNCGIELEKAGVFEKYGVKILGTQIKSIIDTEDRKKFADIIKNNLNEKIVPSIAVNNVKDAIQAAKDLKYPVMTRSAFTLGGLGSGFANNNDELTQLTRQALANSDQLVIDKSLKGWKEIEYEVVRDVYDNCITICNMENIDPVGIHTGESIVVAPSQTLNDYEYNMLRDTAIKVIRYFKIIGECNIQFALDPMSHDYYIIEVNARLSRSSALASKATGYPLAYIAAKLSLGISLTDLKNSVTGETTACFEPSLDYCVVKIPRWDLGKFQSVCTKIGSSMKSVGEVMAISRKFEEAFQKALRMVDDKVLGFHPIDVDFDDSQLSEPTDKRIFILAAALKKKYNLQKLYDLTKIDLWFLNKMKTIIDFGEILSKSSLKISYECLVQAKRLGFSDKQIAVLIKTDEFTIRKIRDEQSIKPIVKRIDTLAAEWPAKTNYLYTTYNATKHDLSYKRKLGPVMVLGSGVYRIGCSVEFDWCSVSCLNELRRLGKKTIMINYNPETVSTDYDMSEKLYFDELSFEIVMDIYELENPEGIILSMGGQLPNNIAMDLHRYKARILGSTPESIDNAENRYKFSKKLDNIEVLQPKWKELVNLESAIKFCNEVEYPCLVRPSYVLSGAAMNVAYNDKDLETYLKNASNVSRDHPVVISKFIVDSKEIDVDAVASKGQVLCMAVSEHVENAGVHSGDATLVTPPQDINAETLKEIKNITEKIAFSLKLTGPFNMQLIAKDNKLKVIECNVRVSRSFPFVSKTLGYDFVALATRCIVGEKVSPVDVLSGCGRVGVKVAQFSFSRLTGADFMLGVEMASTGEVACFGKNRYEAYLKAVISTGFSIPDKTIFLSIGSLKHKEELWPSVKLLSEMGYKLFASEGTAEFYNEKSILVVPVPFQNVDNVDEKGIKCLTDFLAKKRFDLVINLPTRNRAGPVVSSIVTHGYRTRRSAIDYSIPLITDVKCVKLFVEAIHEINCELPKMMPEIDCISSRHIVKLPGLIDIHCHLRDPGQTHKEDFTTGTEAALAGGFTLVLAMPNTNPPIVNKDSFDDADMIASNKAKCDYGLFVCASETNSQTVWKLAPYSASLKMYLNETFTTLKLDNKKIWDEHFRKWPNYLPICVHAVGTAVSDVLKMTASYNRPIHFCHISRKDEILEIKAAKERGQSVTCEVCPHHLFLNANDIDRIGPLKSKVCPPLNSKEDQKALWDNMDVIDCFATDHAPHTVSEKETDGLPGFPGLETILPLLLTAVYERKLKLSDIVEKLHTNPRKIFKLSQQNDTYIEVDLNESWCIPESSQFTKSKWTPYAGLNVRGKVLKVVIRDVIAFQNGKIFTHEGFGQNIRQFNRHDLQKINDNHMTNGYVINEHKNDFDLIDIRLPNDNLLGFISRNLYRKHILESSMFTNNDLEDLFCLTKIYKDYVANGAYLGNILKGKLLALVFYEVSTRTSMSFNAAMLRLGGKVIYVDPNMSSVQKGETLEDTIRVMSSYVDAIVLRHPKAGSVSRAAKYCKNPIINAGDGIGEHPTQSLLDMFTILEEMKQIDHLTITFVGDLKNGRTVHSLAKLLSLYKVKINYVSPISLMIPQNVFDFVEKRDIEQQSFHNLNNVIHETDVLYVTRVQRERFKNEHEYFEVRDEFIITPSVLEKAKKNMILMHPLPRVNEITPDCDSDSRAVYFKQAEYGMYVRMALLTMVLYS